MTKRFLRIERRGIGIVADDERSSRPVNLFFLWAGTTLTVFTVVYGAGLIAMGLTFGQALAAIVLGNALGFALLGLTSIQGSRAGTSTHVISRASFGIRGARMISFFAWCTLVGFEAGGLILIVFAALTLLSQAGIDVGSSLRLAIIVLTAVVQLLLPLLGYAAVMKAQKVFTYIFAVMFALMAALIAPKVEFVSGVGASPAVFTVAIAFVMSAGGLSWASMGSDYSRYLRQDASKRQIFLWAGLGGFVPYVLLMALGAAVASVVSQASDPISGLPDALPGWFVVPYLLLAIVTLLAVNTTDLYSSGLNLQAAGVPIPRWGAVVVDLVLCVIVTYVAITNESFYTYLNVFLSVLIIWLAPWVAVYLVDWVLRRGRYDSELLFEESPSSPYWRTGGVNMAGVAAQVLGMVAATLWVNTTAFVGPLSSLAGGSDLSIAAGAAVAGVAYWLLAARPEPKRDAPTTASAPGATTDVTR